VLHTIWNLQILRLLHNTSKILHTLSIYTHDLLCFAGDTLSVWREVWKLELPENGKDSASHLSMFRQEQAVWCAMWYLILSKPGRKNVHRKNILTLSQLIPYRYFITILSYSSSKQQRLLTSSSHCYLQQPRPMPSSQVAPMQVLPESELFQYRRARSTLLAHRHAHRHPPLKKSRDHGFIIKWIRTFSHSKTEPDKDAKWTSIILLNQVSASKNKISYSIS
jgi:hypothetical protein